jgi:translation initiation factor IF-2
VAHLLVTRGTLKVGDVMVCGHYWGRVRALIDDKGIKIRAAGPSIPVKCLGLSGVPEAGEQFKVYPDDKIARDIAKEREEALRVQQLNIPRKVSLETLLEQSGSQDKLTLRIILKCDTQGSVGAIHKLLEELKSDKISLSIILSGVGNITENDVLLASASNAIIVGFNISKDSDAVATAKREGVEIRLYSIIYNIYDEIKEAMQGMLKPLIKEQYLGRAEVKQVFQIAKRAKVAGCLIVNGRVASNAKVRVKRDGEIIYNGGIVTLKRYQDDVSEVREGQECGIRLDNYADFLPGDILEFYLIEKIAQNL